MSIRNPIGCYSIGKMDLVSYPLPTTGIITLPPTTVGYTTSHIFLPKTVYSLPLFHPLSTFSFQIPNISFYLPSSYAIPRLQELDLSTLHHLSSELSDLQKTADLLDYSDSHKQENATHAIRWSIGSTGSLLLLLVCLVVGFRLYTLWKFNKSRQATQQSPQQPSVQVNLPTLQTVVPAQPTAPLDETTTHAIQHMPSTTPRSVYPPFELTHSVSQ